MTPMEWTAQQAIAPRSAWLPNDEGITTQDVVRAIRGEGKVSPQYAAKKCGLSVHKTLGHLRAALALGYVKRYRCPNGSHLYEAMNIWNPKVSA